MKKGDARTECGFAAAGSVPHPPGVKTGMGDLAWRYEKTHPAWHAGWVFTKEILGFESAG
jgi:hypothetical protein